MELSILQKLFICKNRKKAYFFTVDALLALFVIVTGILMISTLYIHERPGAQIGYLSQDFLNLFSEPKISDMNNSYLSELIQDGNITDLDNSVLEQIGILWVTGKQELAEKLARNISHQLIPDNYGYSFIIGNDTILTNNRTQGKLLTTYRSMITGIEKSKPILGTSSRIFLTSLFEYSQKEYIYFGGFVGQGNITRFTSVIPSDCNVTSMTMELEAGDDFSLYINEIKCGDFVVSSTNMTADLWDISSCNDMIVAGAPNNFSIVFDDDTLGHAYLAGGYIEIDYQTKETFYKDVDSDVFYFPGVSGVANIYSSFFVPGQLHSMKIYMHFNSNYTTYLSVGDRIVFNMSGTGVDQEVTLSNDSLTSFPVLLDYDSLSNRTIPLRFASFNTTLKSILSGGNADVIIITDLSGSMKGRIGYWSYPPVGNAIPNCKPSDMSDPDSRRLGIAGCLDSEINDIVMNESTPEGNRLWLVDFSENANPFFSNDLTELTHDDIEQEIVDRYKSKSHHEISGGTCICCGINQAYQIFDAYSNSSREKFLIVMTDGIATYCCGRIGSACDENGIDTVRRYWPGNCYGTEDDCSVNDCLGPSNNAINSAQRLHDDLNVTIYSVGMGPLSTCDIANYTIAKIAEAGNGSYVVSSDGLALMDFYRQIGQIIVNSTELSSQTLVVRGNLTPSVLYGDSYIELNYTPRITPVVHGEIPIYYNSPDFDLCSGIVNIPKGIRIIDAKMTSYSGIHWTDHLSVQNSNGTFEVFNLTAFSNDYTRLGDPYIISIPADYIASGENNIFTLRTGDSPTNSTGCSKNNSLIFTGLINIINSTLPYSEVLPNATGCTWTIELDVGINQTLSVPDTYSGAKVCEYTNFSHDNSGHDTQDSYDVAVYDFLSFLDYDNDGRVFINFDEEDLSIDARIVRDIPYLWGPTIAEVRVWQ
ncbi:VWA domain-containing protein [Candidatus Woesearchaeota archaeon]|nr:VWA domain-containing protein [Candidatus Woesearchaeota archaeon]